MLKKENGKTLAIGQFVSRRFCADGEDLRRSQITTDNGPSMVAALTGFGNVTTSLISASPLTQTYRSRCLEESSLVRPHLRSGFHCMQ